MVGLFYTGGDNLGDKRVELARQYSDNYKKLLCIVEKMTILNMERVKRSES